MNPKQTPQTSGVVGFVAALLFLIAFMAYSVYYPWPAGPLSLSSFVALWFRELLLLGFVAGFFVFYGVKHLVTRRRREP